MANTNSLIQRDDMVMLMSLCPLCLNHHSLKVRESGLKMFEEGEAVEKALPDLKVEDRELLVTGLCNNCWDRHNLSHTHRGKEYDRQSREDRQFKVRYHRV